MDISKFTSEVNSVDWESFAVNPYYKNEDVPSSLIALATVNIEGSIVKQVVQDPKDSFWWMWKTKQKISTVVVVGKTPDINYDVVHGVLGAIGNDHGGTYFPVITQALPFVIDVALAGNHVIAKNCALEVLIQLYLIFCPDDWSDKKRAEELEFFVKHKIECFILDNQKRLEAFGNNSEFSKKLVNDLMEITDELKEGAK